MGVCGKVAASDLPQVPSPRARLPLLPIRTLAWSDVSLSGALALALPPASFTLGANPGGFLSCVWGLGDALKGQGVKGRVGAAEEVGKEKAEGKQPKSERRVGGAQPQTSRAAERHGPQDRCCPWQAELSDLDEVAFLLEPQLPHPSSGDEGTCSGCLAEARARV